MKRIVTCGDIVILSGIVLGNLESLLCLFYAMTHEFFDNKVEKTCLGLVLYQPIFYLMLYTIYIGQHQKIPAQERCSKLWQGPLYSFLMQVRLLGGAVGVHNFFIKRFSNPEKFKFISLENAFKTQVFVEFFLLTVPELTVIPLNASNESPLTEWTPMTRVTVFVLII